MGISGFFRAIPILITCAAGASAQYIITTVAGSSPGFPKSPLAGISAPIGHVAGVASDAVGNVYASDYDNNVVVKLATDGTLSILAGNGIGAFSGDGGPGVSASLNLPGSIAADTSGNIYIADILNGRIRRVTPDGVIRTYAGDGFVGPKGDTGPAISAEFAPAAIAADPNGNLYIMDDFAGNVRRIDSRGIITTFAGGGTRPITEGATATTLDLRAASFTSIATDIAGSVYLGVALPQPRVYIISPAGIIRTFAGNGSPTSSGDGGPAINAGLYPRAIATDSRMNVYIIDAFTVRTVNPAGIISTIAGNGKTGFSGDGGSALNASFSFFATSFGQNNADSVGISVDSLGNVNVGDAGNLRVRRIANGLVSTIIGNGVFESTGDGGPALAAAFNYPSDLALDSAGNLYVADANSNVVRRISASGTVSTVAGNRTVGASQEGVQATSTAVQPAAIAVTSTGTLYVSEATPTVKQVSPSGILSTAAGNGQYGCPTENVPAQSASLSSPAHLAVNAAGQLYISDSGCNLVYTIQTGNIHIVAGNGSSVFGGDGGAATRAGVDNPGAITFDASGNLYIAHDVRIRRVDTNGVITTFAGGDPATAKFGDSIPALGAFIVATSMKSDSAGNLYLVDSALDKVRVISAGNIRTIAGTGALGFSGDGDLALNSRLKLNIGGGTPVPAATGMVIDTAGNLIFTDTLNKRLRALLAVKPQFVAIGNLSFSAPSGGKAAKGNIAIAATAPVLEGPPVPDMSWSAQVLSGSTWLSVSPLNGSTPGLMTVTANPLSLVPGVYNGEVVVTLPLAVPPVQTVNVQFTVSSGVPPTLVVDQSQLSFNYATTSGARSQTVIVSNAGGGSLNFTTTASLESGVSANWLSASPQSGVATPDSPVSLAVTADRSMLPAGAYNGTITINGGAAGTKTVQVTMTITTNSLVMLLSQSGLTFTAVQNGGAVPSQTFGVLNLGSGTLNWTVPQPKTLSGGNWLTATPDAGSTSSADPGGAPLVTVSVNAAGLAPGIYYGLVKVVSAGASNTPQEVVAVLQVLGAGTDVASVVHPTSLIFSSPAGASSPSSQIVSVYDPTGTGKSFRSGVVTTSGGNFLVTLPTDAAIPASGPVRIVVQPVVNGLAPGTYNDTLTLQFSDGRVSTAGITFTVNGTAATGSEKPAARDTPACSPTKLIPQLTTLGENFTVPAVYPQGLTALVNDDCGNPLMSGQVTVEFSNGKGLTYMQSLNNGRWDLTWQTGSQQASSVRLTVHAVNATRTLSGDAQIVGAVGAPQPSPQINDGGVVSAASFAPTTHVAPGGVIAIFGSLLSEGTAAAQTLPLPTELGFTTVTLGDLRLPLFYADTGQLNALVPYEAPLNTTLQLLVTRNTTYASPVHVDIVAAQPGVIVDANAQAVAVDANRNFIGPSNPAHTGDLLTMYCLGLGAVTPTIANGAAAPSNPPASTVDKVTVTVGGQNADIYFAGLTPTLAGLYQINFYVPPASGTGDQVPVVVSTGGQTSVAVNLSLR